jgi:parvulin-like peptidyl-prolyl isomerase
MLAALLLQGSLLVAPLELGPEPPETRAIAAVRVGREDGSDAEEAARYAESLRERARGGEELVELARHAAAKPTASLTGLYGTYWRGSLAPETAEFLFSAEVGEVNPPPAELDAVLAGTLRRPPPLVARRLERDAACRQVFVAGTDASARARAEAILRELRAGADFARVACERSDDEASALRGGDLAIFERGPDDALLREAAFRADLGEIVGPVQSPLGFHVLQRVPVAELDPRLRDDVWARARGILIASGSASRDRRTGPEAERLAAELAARIRRGEDMAALAREHDDDPGGRERAGDLGWVRRRTTRMPHSFDRLFVEPPGTLIGPLATPRGWVLLRREDRGPRSRIDLRTSAVADLEQWVRRLAERGPEPELAGGLAAAAARAGALGDELGSPLAWGLVEGELALCESAMDFVRRCEALPERSSWHGREVALRESAVAFARALAAAEPYFLDQVWPRHERAIDAAASALRVGLTPLGASALDELMEDLEIDDPRVVIPVYLVAEAPGPGAATHRAPTSRGEPGAACFVDADGFTGALQLEVVLHEALHALDLASAGRPTALNALRERLSDRGRLAHDAAHLLMFVEAAAVVRRVFDERHADHGEVAGVYARQPERSAAVRAAWTAHLEGRTTRDQALAAIAAAHGG